MFRTGISNNGIIVINRGDNFSTQLFINKGESGIPENYVLSEWDRVYFSICEPNQSFEAGVVRKIFTYECLTEDNAVEITLKPSDTINLLPGTYYYEIKLKLVYNINDAENGFIIDTIVPRRKLVICWYKDDNIMKTHIKGKIGLTNKRYFTINIEKKSPLNGRTEIANKSYSILGEDKKTKAKTSAGNQNKILEGIKRSPFVGRGVVDYMRVK